MNEWKPQDNKNQNGTHPFYLLFFTLEEVSSP